MPTTTSSSSTSSSSSSSSSSIHHHHHHHHDATSTPIEMVIGLYPSTRSMRLFASRTSIKCKCCSCRRAWEWKLSSHLIYRRVVHSTKTSKLQQKLAWFQNVSKYLYFMRYLLFDIFQVVLLRFCSSTTSQAPNLHLATQLPLLLFFFPTPAHIVNAHLAVCYCQRPILKAPPVMLKTSTFWPSLTIEILEAFKVNVEKWQTSAIWRSLVIGQVVSVSGTHYGNVWYQATSHWYGQLKTNSLTCKNKHWHWRYSKTTSALMTWTTHNHGGFPKLVLFVDGTKIPSDKHQPRRDQSWGRVHKNSPISISQLWKDSLEIQLASWYLLVSRLIGVLNEATWKNQRVFSQDWFVPNLVAVQSPAGIEQTYEICI